MRKLFTIASIAMVATIVASPAQAQRGNASDVTGPPPWTPGPGNNGNGVGNPKDKPGPKPGNGPKNIVMLDGLSLAQAAAATSYVSTAVVPVAERLNNSVTFNALIKPAGAPKSEVARTFVSRFNAVVAEPTPQRIALASAAFNAMVNSASASYLANPPAEFVEAQSVLQQLVVKTTR